MSKILIYIIFIVIYLVLTFFGLGPVILADGSSSERITTLLIVILAYAVVTLIFRWLLRRYTPGK
jgi:protein-S-isoprenylcysteine O-methyltransferase Ste14